VVRKPKIQKVKEKKKKKINVENISPNKIVVCTEMVIYIVYFSLLQVYCDGYIFPRLRE
jgi:hypothetical protein